MKRILKFIFPVLTVVFLSTTAIAQPIASGSTNSKAESQPPGNGGVAPIGGGIFLLLVMAAGYGIKKNFDARNNSVGEVSS